ncbi:MAG: hypothetical protein V1944_00490 [Candidatus Aenigmatarchaeota archaeon]
MEKAKLVLLAELLNEFVQSDEHNGNSIYLDEPIFIVLDELDAMLALADENLQQEIDHIDHLML